MALGGVGWNEQIVASPNERDSMAGTLEPWCILRPYIRTDVIANTSHLFPFSSTRSVAGLSSPTYILEHFFIQLIFSNVIFLEITGTMGMVVGHWTADKKVEKLIMHLGHVY